MHYFQLETNEKQRFVFQMKYGKHPVSTSVIFQLYGYFRHFAEHLTCNSYFHGCNRPRKLKTANIYPHIFEAKTRKFGDAKIFHFTVYISEDSCLKWRVAQPELIAHFFDFSLKSSGEVNQVWLCLREILRQLVSVGSLNSYKFNHLAQNARALFFGVCKPNKLTIPSTGPKCHICHHCQ